MDFLHHPFLNLVLIGAVALFPPVNPIGTAIILNPYFSHLTRAERKKAVLKITLNAFGICITTLFLGHFILQLFGISLPIIQLAGGILICKMGWEFLSATPAPEKEHQIVRSEIDTRPEYDKIRDKLFFPITFPTTTGAGTISVLLTLGAREQNTFSKEYWTNMLATMGSVLIMCILIYVFFLNSRNIIHVLGKSGEIIINRISAFLIFAVGLQIGYNGIAALIRQAP